MRIEIPNKIAIIIISIFSLAALIGLIFLGIKLEKKVYRYITRPRPYDTRKSISDLNIAPTPEGLTIFVASSLDRIFLNGKTLDKPAFSASASISAARNEYTDFQIVVDSPSQDQPGVYLLTSDFVNTKTGSKISKDNFTWRVVGYVKTRTPYYPVKYVGFWPDPLIPTKSYDIKAGNTQPFWLTLYVPKDTPAGDYTASVTVKGLNFAAQTIPVNLHVYKFTLPVQSHLKTAFDFYGVETHIRYPQGDDESDKTWNARLDDINDKFIVNMIKHRMNPILNIDPTSQAQLSNIDRYVPLGLNNFAIGKHGGTFENNWPSDDPSIEALIPTYQGYAEDLKMNGYLDYTYIYTWDEDRIGHPLVPKIASMIHRAYHGLKNMVCYHGIWDPDLIPDWGKDIDIWTLHIDSFNLVKMRKLQKIGIEMWLYSSGMSGSSTPNFGIDFDSMDDRIIPWMCWKYDFRGFLYWCVNWWPDPKVDPFKSASNTQWQQNGNGLLFYPGTDGPWDSIRSENFRDGMQDYEYIQILLNKLKILHAKGLESKYKNYYDQSVKLLTVDDSIVKDVWNFTHDGAYLIARRNAIAQQIDQFDQLGLVTP